MKINKKNPLEFIIAKKILNEFEKKIGKDMYKEIKKETNEILGISMLDAVQDFSKFDLILRKKFGNNTIKIERQVLKNIIDLNKKITNNKMIIIKNPQINEMIFKSYADPIKKAILEILLKKPKSIPQTIIESNFPQSSTYNKIKELIKDGLITMIGYTEASDGRKVNEYETTFSRIIFDIQGRKVSTNVKLQDKFFKNSYILNSILND